MSLAHGGTPPTARKPPRTAIEWETFHPNMVMSTGPDGESILSRREIRGYDIALGKGAMTDGLHEWTVALPRTENCCVGVATWDCARNGAPDHTTFNVWSAYARHLMLHSVAASAAWTYLPAVEGHATVRVLLDMDARTLSFSRNDGEMRVAYTGLPDRVHPYLCSGADGEVFSVLK
jgi:hypothetical protein